MLTLAALIYGASPPDPRSSPGGSDQAVAGGIRYRVIAMVA
jgi:hypothetical protein